MKQVQTLHRLTGSPQTWTLANRQYSQDRWCILPTCLVPGSSLPEPAQRLSGSVPGHPPLAQSQCRPDILPAWEVLLPTAARQQRTDVMHHTNYADY